MKRLLPAAALLGALAVAPAAFADEPAVDTIHLRNGGLYRGRATEIVPGDHVTVQLPDGQTKVVPWPEVDRVIVASTPVPPPPTEAKPVPVPTAITGPTVRVHVKSSGKTFLYRKPPGQADFVTACESPCDQELPLGDTYKIGGTGISTTKEFRLDGQPGGTVDLDVDGPSWLGIVGGGTLTLAGGVVAYIGVIFALAGGATSTACSGSYCKDDSKNIGGAGLALMAIGAAGIAGGLLIVFPSLKTDISQDSGPKRDAFVRTPQWRTGGLEQHAPVPNMPIVFSHSF